MSSDRLPDGGAAPSGAVVIEVTLLGGNMKLKAYVCATALVLVSAIAAPVSADTVDVYTIGSNPAGKAENPAGVNIGGIPIISWNHIGVAGPATLSIVAEGIDTIQDDKVFFNDALIGFLTQQLFLSPDLRLNPGPGALAGITGLTTSVFDVIAVNGINTVRVEVDPQVFVSEIETSVLSVVRSVPEPGTLAMFALGAAMLVPMLRRRRV
jgi:hypothetical protein